MAKIVEESEEECRAVLEKWIAEEPRPQIVIDNVRKYPPHILFRLKSTGQRVIPSSYGEDGTMTVIVSSRFNWVWSNMSVFGIDPNDLEECDLPGPGEKVGISMTRAEQIAHVNERRKAIGVPLLTPEEVLEHFGPEPALQ